MTVVTKNTAHKVTDTRAAALIRKSESLTRLQGMLSVFKRANQTLSGMPCEVVMVNEPHKNAPAWSDGKTITFNAAKVGDVHTTDDLIKITGLDFHELGHNMFTPRIGTWIVDQVIANNAFRTFNILEDQRLETLLSARFFSTKAYFQMVILKYLLNDKSTWNRQHILTYGRRYLPDAVRDEMRNRFFKQDALQELESLIDAYRQIAYPSDEQQALHIILRFHALLKSFNMDDKMDPPPDPFGHGCRDQDEAPSQGESFDAEQQEDAQTWVDEGYDEWEEPEDDAESDDESDDDGQTGSSKSDDADDSDDQDDTDDQEPGQGGDWEDDDDADDDYNGGDTEDDADDDVDGDTDGDGEDADDSDDVDGDDFSASDGDDDDSDLDGDAEDGDDQDGDQEDGGSSDEDTDGNGSTGEDDGDDSPSEENDEWDDDDSGLTDDALKDLMDNIYDGIASDPMMKSQLRERERAIQKTRGKLPNLDDLAFSERAVSAQYKKAQQTFQKELQRLWADSDPGWDQYRPSGRVNVARVVRGDDLDSVFDQWNEGVQQANDIDMVLLVDFSSSMKHVMDQVSQSLWAIKRSVEAIHGEVTVLGFNQHGFTMYTREDKARKSTYRSFMADDWTDPGAALAEAYTMLDRSRAKHKIMLVLTDGEWDNVDGNNEVIRVLNSKGVLTAIGYLPTGWRVQYELDELAKKDPAELEVENFHFCKAKAIISNPAGLALLAKSVVKEAMTQR